MENKNIDDTIIKAFKEYNSLPKDFKENLKNYSFKAKKATNFNINLEKFRFSAPSRGHLNISYFARNINTNFIKKNKI